ncbi:hypothetical protein A3D00_00240 [Candidatus Woesebacteria bacterium RIFCSPHIGHO2_02_FULL_38_9]|uniref:Methyltransferase type 11 domain-containing protein n=1 Tax=Candidatus Woesebacteria bacterium RIFCSPHIGHO2_01_FULL_39_28 TaxID=1802496 RepID=A0A1F7YEH6_9BACT|nr:MAG: hypothetical protein A2627_03020 [Candidatus Woesebacteria bacterium RIFCSPHIGHO2_01_FULL_39_28]OGM35288.1 MAG: hypothetical protein A3D00_00240 [Candidatus Woesebacteria bacterium RIFCSPHIGHO2_02_FULL_38_9]OGM58019.1 MAG: hypothetical protein A3A50_02030 [Candidatus Woesebacteria bacterium RIFCSPLOWO2_01_FULL_38_20]
MIDYSAWNKFSEGKTPATTPLPIKINKYLMPSRKELIVDVGCGWGRVTTWLYLMGYRVVGTDINKKEIEKAKKDAKKLIIKGREKEISFQVDDASEHIKLPSNSADGVVVNGVLLAMTTVKDRKSFVSEIHRILKPEGIIYLAEFAQTPDIYNYRKHALITRETGTVVGFKHELKITFKDKTDEGIKALGKPKNIDYFAHHYTKKELEKLLVRFQILEFNKVKFITRSGIITDGFVIYGRK